MRSCAQDHTVLRQELSLVLIADVSIFQLLSDYESMYDDKDQQVKQMSYILDEPNTRALLELAGGVK